MRVSLRWLGEFIDLPTTDAEQLVSVFNGVGIEVEEVHSLALPFSGVVVARVEAIRSHPSADRVRLVTIDDGAGGKEVVCGAWNFEAGATVAYATVGSVLAGGLEVGERTIRGVRSPGMISSERELGLGEEGGGILVLDRGAPGEDVADQVALPDVVFDVAITPNRPDAMSVYGIARDLAAFYDIPLRPVPVATVPGAGASRVAVRIEDPEGCPRFTAREIGGVTVGPSPLWMRQRLRAGGQRPISNIVDVTNYVMLELGQPLHAFDLDLVPDETIVVRRAAPGERLRTLDGVDRRLDAADLVIASPREALGLAGIMGGGDSEVSDTTRRVLLEVAHFEPTGVLLTGKRHGLRTEAVARFERGVDPELPPVASARATALIGEVAGGSPIGPLVDEHPRPHVPVTVALPSGEVERLLGVALERDETAGYLTRLGFTVKGSRPMRVTVPSFRPDVSRPADLVEEVARLHGFDRIPARLPRGGGGGLPPDEVVRRAVRRTMIGAGFFETMSFDFVGLDEIAAFVTDPDDRRRRPVRLRNPLSDERAFLRTTLIPGLLDGIRINQAQLRSEVALFEMGTVFFPSSGELPEQPHHLAFAAAGRIPGPSWEPAADRDARDAVGLLVTLFGALRTEYALDGEPQTGFHPGRSAAIVVGGNPVGVVGEIHPAVAGRFAIDCRVVAGELDLAAFAPRLGAFTVPSALPPVVFDLAFDLAEAVPAGALIEAIRRAGGEQLERIVVFDVFGGPPLDPGRKSVAVRLTYRDPGRTLTDQDLVPVRGELTAVVLRELGGRLRGA
ncbi:MAG: phenylalanine--tRNA ligase subunit beta [Actinomycetota bacterium]